MSAKVEELYCNFHLLSDNTSSAIKADQNVAFHSNEQHQQPLTLLLVLFAKILFIYVHVHLDLTT